MNCGVNRELFKFLGFSIYKIKILEPEFLRNLYLKKLKDTLELYGGGDVNEEKATKTIMAIKPLIVKLIFGE